MTSFLPPGRSHVAPTEDPDVTIVVGMEEFHEYSRALCCWSDYFHAALRSGMSETRSMRFEFADRDPDEWRMISSMVAPFATTKVTMENVHIALSWFDELCCKGGLEECDRVLKANILSALHPEKETSRDMESMEENVDHFMQTLSTSIQFGLEDTKQSSIAIILRIFDQLPTVLNEEHIEIIVTSAASDDDCESLFWGHLALHIPQSLSGIDKSNLVRNACLPALITSQMKLNLAEKRLGRLFEVCDWGGRSDFRQKVKEDPILKDAVPNHWMT